MKVIKVSSFVGRSSWDTLSIAKIEGATIRLHWADKPYIWHKNDGDEVFLVLEGRIRMHYRLKNKEYYQDLNPGEICYLQEGEEHVACPQGGPARVLVIEKEGSN